MEEETINLVSLGDSIATGTLTPFSRTYSHVSYLQRKLQKMGYQPKIYKLAHDGDTSRDLLWKLNHSEQLRNCVKRADFIVISIGGNDLMRASSVPGFASIHVHTAEHGTRDFIQNWPQIIEGIRGINCKGKIVVLNLYNPYNHTQSDRKLHETTDRFLTQINGTIAAYAENRYKIADTYSAFKRYAEGKMHQMTCMYPVSVMRNPHPAPRAQKIIADLILEQFELQHTGDRAEHRPEMGLV